MPVKDFILAVSIMAIWGVNFSVIKLGMGTLDSFTLNGLRFLLCAFPLVFFVKKPDLAWKYIASYGLLFGVGVWGMVGLGIHFGASAGVTSLILQLSAFLVVLTGAVIFKEKLNIGQYIGLGLALIGLLLIASVADGRATLLGMGMVMFAALALSSTIIMFKYLKVKQMFGLLVWSSLFSPIPLFAMAYFVNGMDVFTNLWVNLTPIAIFSLLFQAYPTTLLGRLIFNNMIVKYPMNITMLISFLVPIFGLLGSYIIFDEQIGLVKIISCSLIIIGLAVSTFWLHIRKVVASKASG
ncbi:MAG: EamA family transporter [Rhizobiales bacterium]|nr:EamA family transporter [Hyphomicrobiales bacterium]NRB13977.1 EamA family transporter [Hyphomicrobiales bacterium]